MAWVYLLMASALEITWAVGLKFTEGFTKFWPSACVLAVGTASVVVLSKATQTLPIGTAYAVWTGLGAAGTAILGMVFFHEPRTAARLGCIALIVLGVIGLHVFSE